ncbi:MAG TPA: FAD-dependent tricarballylate dehydrogenase TcuA [Longimicrobiales bacterium]
MESAFDVIVVGAGNAAFCAAHAARETGARVLMLEKAPRTLAGGNTYFTAGAIRTTYDSLDDLRPLLADLSDEDAALIDLPPYTPEDFAADMRRLTQGRCDPELTAILVGDVADTIRWLHDKGVRFRLMFERQAFRIKGRYRFWGGLDLGTVNGGPGLIERHTEAASAAGIRIRYETAATSLLQDSYGRVTGVICMGPDGREEIRGAAVVLACGGFEADPRMRAAYLGPNWDLAKVRGTPYNTGAGLQMALDAGAEAYGHWSGCHSIAWDAAAPAQGGDVEIGYRYSKQSYPIGIVVNRDGERFLDEGADFRTYTYAKYGAEILKQPGAIAWQLFDATTEPLLRQEEYTAPGVSRTEADSIRELAEKIGVDPDALERTVEAFNAAVQPGEFDPSIKDGKRTVGITPPKSNWAVPLERPPFLAFAVTCGITMTFGGVRIDAGGRVLGRDGRPIPGLYAAGELVGGLFYHNYPGGSGLASGAVFGRRAGRSAGTFARGQGGEAAAAA